MRYSFPNRIGISLIFWLIYCPTLYAFSDAETPHQPASIIRYQRSIESYQIPATELIDRHGQPVILSKLLNGDRPVVLNFIFTTCPSFCPILSATFGQIQNELANDSAKPQLVSISIDPEHDTPTRLKAYAKKFKAGSNWTFLTGSYDSILEIQRVFRAYKGEKMNHVPLTFLHHPGSTNWLRLEGFTSGKDLLREYHSLATVGAR